MLNKNVGNRYIENWRDILRSLGYCLNQRGSEIRTQAIFRGGSSDSIVIYPETFSYYDFKEKRSGSIEQLIGLTTGADSDEIQNALQYIEKNPNKGFKQIIDMPRAYSEESLKKFIPDYSYFEGRGISPNVQRMYEAGMVYKERFSYRITFPIRAANRNNKIIGFAGRYVKDIKDEQTVKWMLYGPKRFFVYNYKLCVPAIRKDKTVVLVESIGDSLSFAECGIFNTLTLFGTDLSKSLKLFLISQNPNKIIISTNNDENQAGQTGAEKIREKLLDVFGNDKVEINLPPVNDWNEVLMDDWDYGKDYITDWYKKISFEKNLS